MDGLGVRMDGLGTSTPQPTSRCQAALPSLVPRLQGLPSFLVAVPGAAETSEDLHHLDGAWDVPAADRLGVVWGPEWNICKSPVYIYKIYIYIYMTYSIISILPHKIESYNPPISLNKGNCI